MFKNYIFDLYGTLIDIRTDEDDRTLWEKMAIFYGYREAVYTPSELRQKYLELCGLQQLNTQARHKDYQKVDFDLTAVFRKLYEAKGITVTEELVQLTANTFRCYSTKFIKLYDGVIDLLDSLKAKGKKVFLLSNAQGHFTRPELDMMGITKYFDDIVISSEVECAKPDTHIYEILFERNGLSKDNSIMIGNDCVSDIRSAYEFGIQSLYIHQEISPPLTQNLLSTWRIMDGDVTKIKSKLLR